MVRSRCGLSENLVTHFGVEFDMPEITWENINKTILVWGKFSDGTSKNFASGAVTSDFVKDINPVYYSQFNPEAIKLTKFDPNDEEPAPVFGGFLFRRPTDPVTPGGEPWKPRPILPLTGPELSRSFPKTGVIDENTKDTVIVPWALREGKKAYEELYDAVQGLRSVLCSTERMSVGHDIENQSFYNRVVTLIENRVFANVKTGGTDKNLFAEQNVDALSKYFLTPSMTIDQLLLSGGTTEFQNGVKDNIEALKTQLSPVGFEPDENGAKKVPNSTLCGPFPKGDVFWSHLNQYFTHYKIITDIVIDPIRTPCMMVWFISLFSDQKMSDQADLCRVAKEFIPFDEKDQAQDLSNILKRIAELANNAKDKLVAKIIAEYTSAGKTVPEKDKLDKMVNPQVELYVWSLIKILSPGPQISRQQFFDFTLGEMIESGAAIFGIEKSIFTKKEKLKKPEYHKLTKKWKKSKPMDQTEIGVLFDYMDLEVPSEFPFFEETTDPKIQKSQYEKQNEMFLEVVMAMDLESVVEKSAENYESNLTLLTLVSKAYADTLDMARDDQTGLGCIFRPHLSNDIKVGFAELSDDRRSDHLKKKATSRIEDGVNSLLALEKEASDKMKKLTDGVASKCQLGYSKFEEEEGGTSPQKERLKKLLTESTNESINILVPQETPSSVQAEVIRSKYASRAMTIRAENTAYALLANPDTQKQATKTLDTIHSLMLKPEQNEDDSPEVKKRNEKVFSIPMLLAEIIYSLHDDEIGFDKEHVAHFYLILMDMVRHYQKKDGEIDWRNKIRFAKFYGVKGPQHYHDLALYYYERCKSAFGLIEYAKRIDDIQALSESGATVYVIDDTIDSYVTNHSNGGMFFEAALDGENNATTYPIIDTLLVYVTKDAGTNIVKVDEHCQGNSNSIACRPIFFFEAPSVKSGFFDSLAINDIPDDTLGFTLKTGPDKNPLLVLASSLLDYKIHQTKELYLQGGQFAYRRKYPQNYFPVFKDRDFEGIKYYANVFKQLWCFDDKLAKIFILNRLWNIAKRLGADGFSNNPQGGTTSWNENKHAFDPLPLIRDLIFFRNESDRFHLVCNDTEIPLARTPMTIPLSGVTWKLEKKIDKDQTIKHEVGSF